MNATTMIPVHGSDQEVRNQAETVVSKEWDDQVAPVICEARHELAQRVIDGFSALRTQLREFERDIRELWEEFDSLVSGELILGCSTKKEFCERYLRRTPRAVRYMLAGGNKRGETVSPRVEPTAIAQGSPDHSPAHVIYSHLSTFHTESVKCPWNLLDELQGTKFSADDHDTLKAIVEILHEISTFTANEFTRLNKLISEEALNGNCG